MLAAAVTGGLCVFDLDNHMNFKFSRVTPRLHLRRPLIRRI